MTDDVFRKEGDPENTFFIPYLLLLGILYCAANPTRKAQKFFELCQIDLDPDIKKNDPEFLDLFPKMLEISYDLMLRIYKEKAPTNAPMPKDIWFLEKDVQIEAYDKIQKKMINNIFGNIEKIENESFCKAMQDTFRNYLEPHELRKQVFYMGQTIIKERVWWELII